MPKLKTNRGAAKRFRFTKNKKVKRNHAFARHLKNGKSAKRLRNLRKSTTLDSADMQTVKQLLPYG